MRRPALVVLLVLAACGVGEERFKERYVTGLCEKIASCDAAQISFADQGDCESFTRIDVDGRANGCDYSPKDGATCLKDLEAASCNAALTMVPSCAAAYTGGGCAWSGEPTTTDE